MVNKVRLVDYLKYANHQLDCSKRTLEKNKEAYAAAKVVYEAKFLPKLFGWKFEDSGAGDTSWLHGCWKTSWLVSDVKRDMMLVDKLEYHQKIGDTLVDINPDHERHFYKYCKDNNIPY